MLSLLSLILTVMMNDLLRDNDIVKKVLKKIIEDDLFIKLEKYIQKIREIEFLEVVIRPDRVKTEKEKVQRVVDWPVMSDI